MSPESILKEESLTSDVPPVRPGGTLSTSSSSVPPHARVDDEEDEADVAPPKPPRPVSQFDQGLTTLKEAFPNTDAAVVKAVLMASGGKVEPAFNALLGMSDPSFVAEEEVEHPPPQPPRPQARAPAYEASPYNDASSYATSTPLTQMEADELYARQLAEYYGGRAPSGGAQPVGPRRSRGDGQGQRRQQPQQGQRADGSTEHERSFMDGRPQW